MEPFFWWSDEHKKLAEEAKALTEEVRPRAEEAWWKREFPWDIIKKIAERGYFGVGIPKEYGGVGLGTTGSTILTEELSRLPCVGFMFAQSRLGGVHQIHEFGTEEQKKRYLPRIAKGELSAICVTEPFAGTDASAEETFARRDGDKYIITGKKRFNTGIGVSNLHMLYARTSDKAEDVRQNKHLTGFIVERGLPGFSLEKINELIGFDNLPNGYLNLDEVPVSVDSRIGEEGQGWRVMMSGFNYERTLIAAGALGGFREMIRSVVTYGQRRIQFGQPTIDLPTNRFKVADMIAALKLSRLATYYVAHLIDTNQNAAVDAAAVKLYSTDMAVQLGVEAVQCMGGDGVTKFYPLERILRDSKITHIAGGTNEAMKLVIFSMGLREMAGGSQPHPGDGPESCLGRTGSFGETATATAASPMRPKPSTFSTAGPPRSRGGRGRMPRGPPRRTCDRNFVLYKYYLCCTMIY